MGRWAQSQRRGGYTAPLVPPLIDCDNVQTTNRTVGADTVWTLDSYLGPVPPGVDRIYWSGGADDCTEDGGNVLLVSMPQDILTVPGLEASAWFSFAWGMGDTQFPFGCVCTNREI